MHHRLGSRSDGHTARAAGVWNTTIQDIFSECAYISVYIHLCFLYEFFLAVWWIVGSWICDVVGRVIRGIVSLYQALHGSNHKVESTVLVTVMCFVILYANFFSLAVLWLKKLNRRTLIFGEINSLHFLSSFVWKRSSVCRRSIQGLRASSGTT